MLKMGRMCHCGNTLWKVDPSDGSIIWSRNRGDTSNALAYRSSGSDLFLYEAGNDAGADGAVTAWHSESGNTPSKLWTYDPSTSAADAEIDTSETALWIATGTALRRLNLSNGGLINQSGAIVLTTPILYKSPTTGINMHGTGSANVRQYDSSFTQLASRTLSFASEFACKPKGANPEVDGFVTIEPPAFSNHFMRDLNSSLGVVATQSGVSRFILAASTTKVLLHYSGAIRLVTLSGFVQDWSQSLATVPTEAALDSSHNAYTVQSSNSIVRRAAASGSTDWTNTDFTLIGARHLFTDSTNLYLIGSFVYGGDRYQMAAVNLSTGATDWVWTRSSSSADALRDYRMVGGYLYVCGDQM